jgi:hypothetical protein
MDDCKCPLLDSGWLADTGLAPLPRARRRLQLSRAKHRSLAGHSRIAKRVAALIPGYAYDEARFFAPTTRRPIAGAAPRRLRAAVPTCTAALQAAAPR